jgi:hypothetical protein
LLQADVIPAEPESTGVGDAVSGRNGGSDSGAGAKLPRHELKGLPNGEQRVSLRDNGNKSPLMGDGVRVVSVAATPFTIAPLSLS